MARQSWEMFNFTQMKSIFWEQQPIEMKTVPVELRSSISIASKTGQNGAISLLYMICV